MWKDKISTDIVSTEISNKRVIKVCVDIKSLTPSDRLKYFFHKESPMKYDQMVALTREGAKCTRPTWKPGEYVWSDGKILIHTTSYFGEPFNQAIRGYTYVCEQVDVVAEDWQLVSC